MDNELLFIKLELTRLLEVGLKDAKNKLECLQHRCLDVKVVQTSTLRDVALDCTFILERWKVLFEMVILL